MKGKTLVALGLLLLVFVAVRHPSIPGFLSGLTSPVGLFALLSLVFGVVLSRGKGRSQLSSELLASKMDSASVKMMLGQALELRSWYWQKQGYDEAEAQEHAKADVLASLKSSKVDIESYAQVREWLDRYRQQC